MNYRNKGSWDARTYDQVSYLVQYRWGQQVLEWRKWRGNEIVMDAGCGSGLLTKQLAKKSQEAIRTISPPDVFNAVYRPCMGKIKLADHNTFRDP